MFACVISIEIIIATGADHRRPRAARLAKEAAEALRPVAGNGAELLFAVGLLGAQRPGRRRGAAVEQLRDQRGGRRGTLGVPPLRARRRCSWACSPSRSRSGAAVALTPVNLITLLIGTQVLQGIVTPIVLIYILILANRREVLGRHAERPGLPGRGHGGRGRDQHHVAAAAGSTVLGWFGLG